MKQNFAVICFFSLISMSIHIHTTKLWIWLLKASQGHISHHFLSVNGKKFVQLFKTNYARTLCFIMNWWSKIKKSNQPSLFSALCWYELTMLGVRSLVYLDSYKVQWWQTCPPPPPPPPPPEWGHMWCITIHNAKMPHNIRMNYTLQYQDTTQH